MQFEKGIWREAWNVYLINIKTVTIAISIAVALELVTEYLDNNGSYRAIVDLVVWCMVAISMHGTILLNEANLGTRNSNCSCPLPGDPSCS